VANSIKSYKFALGLIVLTGVFLEVPVNAQDKTKTVFVSISEKSSGITPTNNFDILKAKPYSNPLPPPSNSGSFRYTPPKGLPHGPLKPASDGSGRRAALVTGFRAFGSFGIPYTSSSVELGPGTTPIAANKRAFLSSTYPYRAIGKLTFRTSVGGPLAFCSASLIRKSIIVTAAHCVQRFGSGAVRFRDWQFTPGAHLATKPYGVWNPIGYVVPSTWSDGSDIGSGAARDNDIAIFLMAKKDGRFIGDVTGYFTYAANNYSFVQTDKTGNLNTAQLHTLGYAGLFDQGQIMQVSSGPSTTVIDGRAKVIRQGSNLTAGSSGGPWIANFGARQPNFSGGASAGIQSVPNVIVGVTSYGTMDPNAPKDNFSSQFAQNTAFPNAAYGMYGPGNIGAIINAACRERAPGSASTYAALGYCN